MTLSSSPWRGGRLPLRIALVVAAAGLVGFVLALALEPTQAMAGYLIAYAFAATVGLGMLGFVMAAYAIGAGWPVAVRRLAEMTFAVLPLLIVLYLPLLGAGGLYPWQHPERLAPALRDLVQRRHHVMNGPFVFARGLFFVFAWAAFGEALRRGSFAMARGDAERIKSRLKRLSCWALPIVGITGTAAVFDGLMSLSPDFYSTMYGLYVLSGGFVAALGLLGVIMFFAQRDGLARLSASHWHAVGRLLFAFLVFWGYTAYFQYMLVWEGNKPVEAKFFVDRQLGIDRWTSAFLVVGAFALPFFCLLSYRVRRNARWVAWLGGWIALGHYVDVHWLVGVHRGRTAWQWHDLPPLLLIGGLAVAVAVLRQRGHATEAVHDPDYARGLAYESA